MLLFAAGAVLDHFVVRLSGLALLTPATYRPSHFRRNLKFLVRVEARGVDAELHRAALSSVRRSVGW